MTNLTQRYVRKPEPLEGVQLTKTNYKQVALWCGADIIEDAKASDPTDVYIGLEVPMLGTKGVRANVGDFVVRYSTGKFAVLEDHYFKSTYQESAL